MEDDVEFAVVTVFHNDIGKHRATRVSGVSGNQPFSSICFETPLTKSKLYVWVARAFTAAKVVSSSLRQRRNQNGSTTRADRILSVLRL